MTDRPIIFSAPMVRALLEGRKTQTRRLLKPQPVEVPRYGWDYKEGATFTGRFQDGSTRAHALRFWAGDRLWVREAWCPNALTYGNTAHYRADGEHVVLDDGDGFTVTNRDGSERSPWSPSIHMPRKFSRLTLTVTDVRVQRLQEISEEDAAAEGAPDYAAFLRAHERPRDGDETPEEVTSRLEWKQRWFAALWRDLHGPDAWSASPWVIALTFTVERRNIDEPPTELAPLVLHEMEDARDAD